MKKRIDIFIQKFKEANFEQAFIVLVGLFLLGVIFITLTTSPTAPVNPNSNGTDNSIIDNSVIDPNVITKGSSSIYYYKHGSILVTGKSGIYYYQEEPTSQELDTIKTTMGLTSLELVDETYKAIQRSAPIEPVFPEEIILDEPRPTGRQIIPEGMDGSGVVD